MSRLAPAEKLPLANRKEIRDKFESKKADYEKELSQTLGTAWTIDVNPLALFPYAAQDWAKSSFGSILAGYVEGAIYQLGAYAAKNGADGLAELNSIASAHVLTIDLDEAATASYCAAAVLPGGRLAVVFNAKEFGTNTNEALQSSNLLKALNAAPAPAAAAGAGAAGAGPALSFAARKGIRDDYDADIADVRARINKALGRDDIQLAPGFEAAFAALTAAKKADFDGLLGAFVFNYFKGLAWHLEAKKFGSDDMLQEGFNEAVDKGVIAFRIVDSLTYGSYNEVVIEDGTLYIQTTAANYGSNIDDAAQKIIDQL